MSYVVRGATAWVIVMLLVSTAWADPPNGPLATCPPDAVISGTVCMDKYEASVWRVPEGERTLQGGTRNNTRLIAKIRQGIATVADLEAGGATQLLSPSDYTPCEIYGKNCADIFAVSLPRVLPSGGITWFQAQQACKNARKRLPSNAEWQASAVGTPDPGPDNGTTDCNTDSTHAAVATGTRISCKSPDGAYDMVGNVAEWVADPFTRRSYDCDPWSAANSGDKWCVWEGEVSTAPAAPVRGGHFSSASNAGPFMFDQTFDVTFQVTWHGPDPSQVGFRCAR